MPALKPTDYHAQVVWLGRVPLSASDLSSEPVDQLNLHFAGPEGEQHTGLTRESCARVTAQHPKGTEIANVRQLSVVSEEELHMIADDMGLPELDPSMLGASLVLRGLPDLSHVPPSSRLQGESGATLVVDMQNRPCVLPGKVIERRYGGFGKAFKPAAHLRRGVTAWVEREGVIRRGDVLQLHIPDQRAWAP